ncbi:MAG: hypothetical protein V3V99_11275 [candidate division Zixibacteria bacterium]
MPRDDKTKALLEQMLRGLHKKQAVETSFAQADSYLMASNEQFLGRITTNRYDTSSILNRYGPFGSRYSQTSIFNPYSPYGSKYGQFSVNNPYCQLPPTLVINGRHVGVVTRNRLLRDRIPTDSFLHTLKSDVQQLLKGRIQANEEESRAAADASFIIAQDGTYLGSIEPNPYDSESIFNEFGPFGSEYSQTSIFNEYCNYGSPYSPYSPFNEYSSTPPKVYVRGRMIGYLTKNTYFDECIDPDDLLDWARGNV